MANAEQPSPEDLAREEEERRKRFTDTSADHWKVGPKTQAEAGKIKSKEELDALIPLAEEDENEEGQGS